MIGKVVGTQHILLPMMLEKNKEIKFYERFASVLQKFSYVVGKAYIFLAELIVLSLSLHIWYSGE